MQEPRVIAALAALALSGVLTTACGKADLTAPDAGWQAPADREATVTQQATRTDPGGPRAQLPFHSNVNWQFRQVPLPAGRCTEPPEGLAYLWLTELWGSADSTHLGQGPFEGSICVYGQITNPGADPPNNGIPMGWEEGRIVLTAANGDRLRGTVRSTGVTAPPGTPGFQIIEEVQFVNGGTGRFEFAEGQATGYVDPVAQTEVYDGWIRYGKTE